MVLAGLKNGSPKYEEALQIIRQGRERLLMNGLNDFSGFVYCAIDQWREQKYQTHREIEMMNRQSIVSGEKRYDHDK